MPQLVLSCPHCRAERIGFTPRGAAPVRPGVNLSNLFLQCEGCGQGVVAVVGGPPAEVTVWMQGSRASPGSIIKIHPRPIEPSCPADVPDNVRSAFLSGLRNLSRPDDTNAAAMMFGRSIELAAKKLNPNGKGNLKQRIADLSDDYVTPAMKNWAQHIRLDRNDAAHEEEEFSKEDAETLHTFVQMFLTYAFTLPEMLRKAGGTVEEPKS